MPTLWLHDSRTPSGCQIVKTTDGRVDIWEPERPFALSPASYYLQAYPWSLQPFREHVEVKKEQGK